MIRTNGHNCPLRVKPLRCCCFSRKEMTLQYFMLNSFFSKHYFVTRIVDLSQRKVFSAQTKKKPFSGDIKDKLLFPFFGDSMQSCHECNRPYFLKNNDHTVCRAVTSPLETFKGGQCTLSTQLIQSTYLVILLTSLALQFL